MWLNAKTIQCGKGMSWYTKLDILWIFLPICVSTCLRPIKPLSCKRRITIIVSSYYKKMSIRHWSPWLRNDVECVWDAGEGAIRLYYHWDKPPRFNRLYDRNRFRSAISGTFNVKHREGEEVEKILNIGVTPRGTDSHVTDFFLRCTFPKMIWREMKEVRMLLKSDKSSKIIIIIKRSMQVKNIFLWNLLWNRVNVQARMHR